MRRRLVIGCLIVPATIAVVLVVILFLGAKHIQGELEALNSDGDAFLAAHPEAGSVREQVFAVTAGPGSAPATFFLIHGSPGEWRNFGGYLLSESLTDTFRLIVPDRPGYGRSPAEEGTPSLAGQAARLVPWAIDAPGKRIWVGHSFGASVVARLAMDHPSLVDGLILVSGAMDPAFEQPQWYHAVASSPAGKRMLPPDLLVANEECHAFAGDLENMVPLWSAVTCPVFLIHARDDSLADFRHVAFAKERLANASVEVFDLPDGDHFLPWNRREILLGAMLRMARELSADHSTSTR